MRQETGDRRTLGVTPAAQQLLDSLMALGWFREEADVFRLAVSVALARGLKKDPSDIVGRNTKWNVGTLDSDGRLRDLVRALAPESGDRPFAYAELTAHAGLEWLKTRLVDEHAMLSEALSEEVDPTG